MGACCLAQQGLFIFQSLRKNCYESLELLSSDTDPDMAHRDFVCVVVCLFFNS